MSGELEPNSAPLEFSSLQDLALWLQFPYPPKKGKKKKEKRHIGFKAINSISEVRGGPEGSCKDPCFVAGGSSVARLLKSNSHNSRARTWTADSLPSLRPVSCQRTHRILCHQRTINPLEKEQTDQQRSADIRRGKAPSCLWRQAPGSLSASVLTCSLWGCVCAHRPEDQPVAMPMTRSAVLRVHWPPRSEW